MGQEIESAIFKESDFDTYYNRLENETRLLKEKIISGDISDQGFVAGFEVEAWLVDQTMRASPSNEAFLETFNDPMAFPELARFNIELNNEPVRLSNNCFMVLKDSLEAIWSRTSDHAEKMDLELLLIGILPTIERSQLNVDNMTRLNRYRALNEQILRSRGEPVHLDIVGRQHLKYDHNDVMLESAATSFQIHLQVPVDQAHRYYNASIVASFATVAVSANSPFLFGKSLWEETRIPLFEQAVETGGYRGASRGPLRRVSFGSSYARDSIFECFQENLDHFPVLLPRLFDSVPEKFDHLRLHNGTIWRWNRPLVGFNDDGTPHIRIEHRVIPAGPTIIDMIANAAFSYGLIENIFEDFSEPPITFSQAKHNFYQAARHGIDTKMVWFEKSRTGLLNLILNNLIPRAREGLQAMNIDRNDIDLYLNIIHERVKSGRTGAKWQREFIEKHGGDFSGMTACYLENQKQGLPVHEWTI